MHNVLDAYISIIGQVGWGWALEISSFWAPNGTRLSAQCHFTRPKKLLISRAHRVDVCVHEVVFTVPPSVGTYLVHTFNVSFTQFDAYYCSSILALLIWVDYTCFVSSESGLAATIFSSRRPLTSRRFSDVIWWPGGPISCCLLAVVSCPFREDRLHNSRPVLADIRPRWFEDADPVLEDSNPCAGGTVGQLLATRSVLNRAAVMVLGKD